MSRIVTAHVRVTMPDGSVASRSVNAEVPPIIYETDAEQAAATDLAASHALQRAASDVIATLDLPDPTPQAAESTEQSREEQGS